MELFETIYDPYKRNDDDTFDDIYERYLMDCSTILTVGGLVYYKAALIEKINLHQGSLLAALPIEINPRKGCILADEHGNKYKYLGDEIFSFRGNIPAWHSRMIFAVLSYTAENIGHYFAKI